MASHPLTLNLVMQKARVDRPNLVRKLNVSGSQVDDIGIIEQLTALEVVSLAANDISDLGPLSPCESLTEVFLRKNDIVDLFQVLHLRGLSRLRSVTLNDNPISTHECYRKYVIAALPQVEKLDDVPISAEERAAARAEFPDVTACEIPLPLPTKRELHQVQGPGGRPSQQGSPILKRATPTGGAPSGSSFSSPPSQALPAPAPAQETQQPPSSARGQSAAVVAAAAAQRHRRTESSDVGTEGSDADVGVGRRSAGYDERPVGGARPQPAVRAREQQQFADPVPSATPPDESPGEDELYDDSCDSMAPADAYPQRRTHRVPQQARGTPRGGAQTMRQPQAQRPAIPLSPQPMGIREENVVRAVNLLLGELSPAGLDAVRRQLDMLDMR